MKQFFHKVILLINVYSMTAILTLLSACSQRQGPPAPVVTGMSRGDTTVHSNLPSIIVKPGDTVQLLAQRYRISSQEIIAVNNLKKPYHLRKGQKLWLPQKVMGGGNMMTQGKSKAPQFYSSPPKSGQVVTVPLDDEPVITDVSKTEKTATPQSSSENLASAPKETAKSKKFDVVNNVLAAKPKIIEKTAEAGTETAGAVAIMAEKTVPTLKAPAIKSNGPQKLDTPAQRDSSADNDDRLQTPDQDASLSQEAEQPTKLKIESEKISAGKGSANSFSWPLQGEIIEKFGVRSNGLRNDGINIQANEGDPIRSAGDGTVAYVGNELSGFGNLVMIRHAQGWMSAYAHCSEILVKRGAAVKAGSVIAKIGHTGSVRTPQLHFELREKMKAVDPLLYLKGKGAL